jgi:rare lipoprotein A
VRALTRGYVSILAMMLIACTHTAAPKKTASGKHLPAGVQEGLATWYGGSLHGGPTASGERFDKNAMTAAHRTLPMNTHVKVTNKTNGRSVELRINDRGPYGNRRRIIDVSEGAAKRLDMIDAGVVPVRIEVLR